MMVKMDKIFSSGGFLSLELTPIRPLVKEFIQDIVWSNTNVIKSIIQGVLILIIKNTDWALEITNKARVKPP
jgi:hypothetical protein